MRRFAALPRPLLLTAAILFALTTTVYSCIWIYYIRILPQTTIGVAFKPFSPAEKHLELVWVARDSAAERAGLAPGDRILAIDGQRLDNLRPWIERVLHGGSEARLRFTVASPSGQIADRWVTLPFVPKELQHPSPLQVGIMEFLASYPLFFLTVGLIVLFLRLEDPNAWLLALMFTGFIGLANWVTPEAEPLVNAGIRRFAITFHLAARDLLPALFYCFFAVFPVPSPMERKLPWLKWLLLGFAALISIPLVVAVGSTGSYSSVLALVQRTNSGAGMVVGKVYGLSAFVLGLVSLGANGLRGSSDVRRKVRVLMVATAIGLMPMLGLSIVLMWSDTEANPLALPFWSWVIGVFALLMVPVAFAYAVLKHRVMEIPALLKRSARYVLVRRGFALSVTLASAAAAWAAVQLFSGFFTGLLGSGPQLIMPAGMAAAGFGGLLAITGARMQRRVQDRIDRAFFREAYDARRILEDLAQKIRHARSCTELEVLLDRQIREALHPASLAIYIECERQLKTEADGVPPECRWLPLDLPALSAVASRGGPLDVPTPESEAFAPFAPFRCLRPECLVPMAARDGSLVGLAVLGQRLSEEPYSSEDKRLLAAVADQAGLAIDSIRLAEAMAERLEKERRAAQELETARLVQNRLLSQQRPLIKTVEYAGRCVQARAVGGDYYDFLDLGKGCMAIALADVSGKGVPAALLMASVQATLRTHCAAGSWDLAAVTAQMNRLLYESTAPEHFVTMFLGDYDDTTRTLRYVNCGHNPPVLLANDGAFRRLEATARVLGAFLKWDCAVETATLAPGDLVALFTDGITEATNPQDEDFGEERLIDALRIHRERPVGDVLNSVIGAVLDFGGVQQADDLTLILLRGT